MFKACPRRTNNANNIRAKINPDHERRKPAASSSRRESMSSFFLCFVHITSKKKKTKNNSIAIITVAYRKEPTDGLSVLNIFPVTDNITGVIRYRIIIVANNTIIPILSLM